MPDSESSMPPIPVWLSHLPVVGGLAVPWITPLTQDGRYLLGALQPHQLEQAITRYLLGLRPVAGAPARWWAAGWTTTVPARRDREIPEQERDLLESAPVRVIVHEYGAWVHVPPLEFDHDELEPHTDPAWHDFPALLQVLTPARALDADWVTLDADGADIFPHLPTFD